MKILQVSDLHITRTSTLAQYLPKIDRMIETIRSEVAETELLVILVCGDLIDHGDSSGYPLVHEILSSIRSGLATHRLVFEFAPGNHDLDRTASIESKFFDEFLLGFDRRECEIGSRHIVKRLHEGINFLLLNTAFGSKDYGQIDVAAIDAELVGLCGPVIWVGHHTIFSRYGHDSSCIRDAHALMERIVDYKSLAYVHGHTHGYSDITIGRKCKVVGVGPLFKPIEDVNNQFNLLTIQGTQLVKIENFCYRSDTNTFFKQVLYENDRTNLFYGTCLPELYGDAVANVKAMNAVNNFHFNLHCSVDDFFVRVEAEFTKEIDTAKLWLENKLPESMYYNHAQYMNKAGVSGIEHVINELERKSTSSRAIIPLINMHDVVDSGDNHLPSLDVIQFGFDDESRSKIHLTVYMRALEVNHFLKINISEMYHLIRLLRDKFRSIQFLELNIIAFRAQYKEHFGCFVKAALDLVSPHKLTALVVGKRTGELVEMLQEKKGLSETVVNSAGIRSLSHALAVTTEQEGFDFYPESLVRESGKLADLYDLLAQERARTSLQAAIEDIERQILSTFTGIVEALELLGRKER